MRKTKVTITQATQTKVPETIEVPEIETQIAPFHVVGLSSLIVNNFSEKSKQQMEDESTGKVAKGKLGGRGKAPRIPEDEFNNARILDDRGRDCIPARWVKAAIVTAAGMPDVEMSKTLVRQTVFVPGNLLPIIGSKPRMGADMVRRGRFGSKVPMMAYRPYFDVPWELQFQVQFEPKLISPAKLVHLVRRAGLSVGLCEWRPEKNGEFGRFDVKLSVVK